MSILVFTALYRMHLRLVALVFYLAIDIFYVLNSKSYYSGVVKKIQNEPMIVPTNRIWSAIVSYMCLAIGWFFLVAPFIEKSKVWYEAAFYGAIYGIAVYGVFNTTNHVMFKNYNLSVVLRDTIWGMSWLTIFSILYFFFIKNLKK